MAREPKPVRVIRPGDPDLTDLEKALGIAVRAIEVHLRAQKRLLKVICEMPEGPERDAQTKQFKEIFKEKRALPPRPTRELVGLTAYLQPLATLLLAAAVLTAGSSIGREAENKEMCVRHIAYLGNGSKQLGKPNFKKLAARVGVPTNDSYAWTADNAFCHSYK